MVKRARITHGGKRKGAGRKRLPKEERKTMLSIYPKLIAVEKLGKDKAQQIAVNAIEEASAKTT